LAGLLAAKSEFSRQFQIKEDDRIANVGAIFCAAKTKHIHSCLPGNFLWLDAERNDRIGETRAVHVHFQTETLCGFGNVLQFGY